MIMKDGSLRTFVVRCTDDDALEFVRLTFGAMRGMSVEEFVEQCWMSPFQETLSKRVVGSALRCSSRHTYTVGKRVRFK